jgi:hypothetical protein
VLLPSVPSHHQVHFAVFETIPSYRLYRMNALTGAVRSVEDFSAYHDDEAIARALDAAGDQRIELWQDGRKLAAISGRNGPAELHIAR